MIIYQRARVCYDHGSHLAVPGTRIRVSNPIITTASTLVNLIAYIITLRRPRLGLRGAFSPDYYNSLNFS